MKKIVTYVLIAVILVILIITIGSITIDGDFFNFPIGKEKMESIFIQDQKRLTTVTNFLANSDYDNVYIPDTMEDGEMSIDGTSVKINDVEVVEAINTLKKQRYNVIEKDGNTIYFQRWSNLDKGRGIVYSINDNEPILQFLTKIEPLPEPHWYYYEEDYNEWRERNNDIPNNIVGVWDIQYAKTRGAGNAGEDYPLQELYGTDIALYGGKLTFYADGTFSRYVGTTTDEKDKYEGTYILRYDDKILLQYKDGTTATVKYLSSSQEMVYYTRYANKTPIDEYYTKCQ